MTSPQQCNCNVGCGGKGMPPKVQQETYLKTKADDGAQGHARRNRSQGLHLGLWPAHNSFGVLASVRTERGAGRGGDVTPVLICIRCSKNSLPIVIEYNRRQSLAGWKLADCYLQSFGGGSGSGVGVAGWGGRALSAQALRCPECAGSKRSRQP